MLIRMFSVLITLALLPLSVTAQLYPNDPVLFTVGNTPVHQSEFVYIYTKTNGASADFSKKSLEEYLDLYIKFKLKVQKAKEMRLDTLPNLKAELDGYRRQLADSYLMDREVTDKLIQEAYERIQQDVDISHILIEIGDGDHVPMPEDTLAAYQRALEIKKRLEKGEDFAKVAMEVSDDPSAKRNGGRVGFINAILPNGFYDFETAAYTLPVGKLAGPIRTRAGYHLMKVHGKRPARGEIEVAHILVRVPEGEEAAAKAKIDSLYKLLQTRSNNFEDIARANSEDNATASRGGYIGIFGINRYEKTFEDAAFALQKDGDFSKPFRSSIGWHIIKRISKREIQPLSIEKSRLEARIKQDTRFEQSRVAMLERIRRENNFRENKALLEAFIKAQDESFFTFKWKMPEDIKPDSVLFRLGTEFKATMGEFEEFLGRATGKRIRMREEGIVAAVNNLYKEFLDDSCLRFEESQLEKKYPEFRALMREYEEGILLFEATRMLVWDKASQDSLGLEEYYEKIKQKYQWDVRAVASAYKVSVEGRSRVDEIRAYAEQHTPEEVLAKFNTAEQIIVSVEERTAERNRSASTMNAEWREGEMTITQQNRDGSISFTKVEKVLPPAIKTLKEARGYIIADYQDYLEQQWIQVLRQEYQVNVNQKTLNGLIKA